MRRFRAAEDSVSIIPEATHAKYVCPLMKALWIKAVHYGTGRVPTYLVWVASRNVLRIKASIKRQIILYKAAECADTVGLE